MPPHVTVVFTLQSSVLRTLVLFYGLIKQNDCSVLAHLDLVEREGNDVALEWTQAEN